MKIQLTCTTLLLAISLSLMAQPGESTKTPDVVDVSDMLQTPDVVEETVPAENTEPVKIDKLPNASQSMPAKEKVLFQSAYDGDLANVQVQVTKGASVNYADEKKRTAMILAANNGHTAVVEFLYGKGADINAIDGGGMTALMHTAKRSHTETAAFLLNNGAKVNVQSRKKGITALMLASGWGNVELVKMLLDKGANPAIKTKFGVTAADSARARKHSAVVVMLSESTASESEAE